MEKVSSFALFRFNGIREFNCKFPNFNLSFLKKYNFHIEIYMFLQY